MVIVEEEEGGERGVCWVRDGRGWMRRIRRRRGGVVRWRGGKVVESCILGVCVGGNSRMGVGGMVV